MKDKTIHLNFCKVPKECTCYSKYWTELLAQQQQEDYQEVLDLELMQKEELVRDGTGNEVVTVVRNNFRDELYKAIAEKRGKV
jgi:hypothetical protein